MWSERDWDTMIITSAVLIGGSAIAAWELLCWIFRHVHLGWS
jgi:hypothetical protein